MPLFKYLPPARADFFKTLRLRYSQPAEFNDPFEGRPFYLGLVPEYWMIQSYLLSESFIHHGIGGTNEKPIYFLKDVIDLWSHTFQQDLEIAKFHRFLKLIVHALVLLLQHLGKTTRIGALSLSEVNDNLLMWGHYTESHKGFVIEFDPKHPVFETKMTDEDLWKLHKIVYASERPKTYVIDLDMKAILLTKHHSWSYEREWKHFRPLPQATEVLPSNQLPICLFDFPAESIKSVIFGTRIQPETKSKIEDTIRARPNLQHVRLFQMQLDDRNYRLSLIPK